MFNRTNGFLTAYFLHVPCHRKPERCLCIKGESMPICARCLFIHIGLLLLPVFLLYPLPLWLGICLQATLLVDGLTQLKGWRTSTNRLRMATGLISGAGLAIGITSVFWWIAGLMNSI